MKRASSSPPSPVFDLPPMRFIAIASVSCASFVIEPNDIAPVAKRFTISLRRLHFVERNRLVGLLELQQPAQRAELRGSGRRSGRVYSWNVAKLSCRTACCSLLIGLRIHR